MNEQEFEISTLADLLAVPADKQGELLADLAIWMNLRREVGGLAEALGVPIEMSDTMTWVDDGRRGCSKMTIEFDTLGYENGGPVPDGPK